MNKSSKDDPRIEYWNQDYLNFWKERTSEADINKDLDDSTSSSKNYFDAISLLELNKSDVILEVACGHGRSLPFLCPKVKKVFACDISKEMIAQARLNNEFTNLEFAVCSAENMPFEDNLFNNIVCFAAFDAMYQNKALAEFNRVLRINGSIVLTGKNFNYCEDDILAYEAELGAKNKNHPNYFTDVKKLKKIIKHYGFRINRAHFFIKRGDFNKSNYTRTIPPKFYEYLFVLSKVSDSKPYEKEEFSYADSRVFLDRL